MLVLSRKLDDVIEVSPNENFTSKLLNLLQQHCPDLEAFHWHQLGSALNKIKDDPFFRIRTQVVKLNWDRRQEVRLGTSADVAWQIMRGELLSEQPAVQEVA